jgi:imidazolonepropionase-like amidohydrolase
MNLILHNAAIFDGQTTELRRGCDVRIADGLIVEIADRPIRGANVREIELNDRTLMPGLIDAHYHAYAFSLNPMIIDQASPALRALWARRNLEESLQRGFTTVRDAAGGDLSLAIATEMGLIDGPRFYFSGLAIGQTGGHGDLRAPEHNPMCPCAYCGALSTVADGADEIRRAAREQLRRGATQIKLFVSGGALSPSDPYWMNQLTDEEIRVAVEEAATRRTYVMAHALTAEAATRGVRNGVRSVEHAIMMTKEAATEIKHHGAYVVPTLSITDAARAEGKALGLSDVMVGKLKELDGHQLASIELLREQGVPLGFGTDLLGPLMVRQCGEFQLRRQAQSALEVLRSATVINAEILNMAGKLGVICHGAHADLLVVDGDPLVDIGILERPEKMLMVIRGGKIYRNLIS